MVFTSLKSTGHFVLSREGDHIMTEDGLSGIVVGIGEKMAQLEVVRFPSDEQRGPGRVVINNIDK